MTEAEWLTNENPESVFRWMRVNKDWLKLSDRQLWLIFFAMDRHDLTFAEPTNDAKELATRRRIIAKCNVGERWADGLATNEEVWALADPVRRGPIDAPTNVWNDLRRQVINPGVWLPGAARGVCDIFRDIVGNPFLPVRWTAESRLRTATVLGVAQRIYDDRDFVAMPILADVLEDAGCTDAAILDHCRGPDPHVRGCWVVDLILGKD